MDLRLVLFLFLTYLLATSFFFVVYTFGLSKLFGSQLVSVGIGFPVIKKWICFGTEFGLGILPITTSVKLLGDHDLQEYPQADAGKRFYQDLPLWQQFLFAYSFPTVLLAIALCTLAPADFISHLRSALPQFFFGAIRPLSYGQELLSDFENLVVTSPSEAWGVLCTKILPWNLMPFVGFPAFGAICSIYQAVSGRELYDQVNGMILFCLWLLGVAPIFAWMIAIAVFTFR
jgi:hypothetical protein